MEKQTLDQMKNIDIRTVDPTTLVDISSIPTDPSRPPEERIRDYVRQVKNPYCVRVRDVPVKISYVQGGPSLADRLESMMMKM